MHHGADVDEHGLVELGDGRRDQAFLHHDAVAQDHSVNDTPEGHHRGVELVLDSLRLPKVQRFNVEHARRRHFLGQLLKATLHQILPVPHKNDQLAQVALEDLPGDRGTHSTRGTRQKDTLTRELLLKLQRRLVRFRDLFLLFDHRLSTRCGRRLHGKKVRKEVS